MRWVWAFLWAFLMPMAAAARAAETIPPAPRDHFNDYAGVVSSPVARRLNERLAGFERETGNQVVVAVFPRMQSEAPVGDYTLRVARAWGAGQAGRDNGVVLFAFMQERELYLQVGTGLEAKIPDPLAQSIIDDKLVPRFRSRDFDRGFTAGVDAILAALRAAAPPPEQVPVEAARPPVPGPEAEQRPAAQPLPVGIDSPSRHSRGGSRFPGVLVFAIVIVVAIKLVRLAGGAGPDDYGTRERRRSWPVLPLGGGGGIGSARPGAGLFGPGRSSFGGASRRGGGGSFSGGGGGFRGGGAGGKW